MDAQAEKIALFRYALVAPLVLETLPRGELTRRAEEIAARQYESHPLSAARFLSIPCSSGLCVTVRAASKPWPPNLARTGDSRAPSRHRWRN
jgi:hypothetical protein